MDYSQVFAISAAGLSVESMRVKIAALNMANAHTAAAPGQSGYKPLHVVASSPQAQFSSHMGVSAIRPNFRVETSAVAPRLVMEPGHPMADAKGFVAYPGVDSAAQMLSLMSATRAYEANLAAMNTARTLALKALDIGGNQ